MGDWVKKSRRIYEEVSDIVYDAKEKAINASPLPESQKEFQRGLLRNLQIETFDAFNVMVDKPQQQRENKYRCIPIRKHEYEEVMKDLLSIQQEGECTPYYFDEEKNNVPYNHDYPFYQLKGLDYSCSFAEAKDWWAEGEASLCLAQQVLAARAKKLAAAERLTPEEESELSRRLMRVMESHMINQEAAIDDYVKDDRPSEGKGWRFPKSFDEAKKQAQETVERGGAWVKRNTIDPIANPITLAVNHAMNMVNTQLNGAVVIEAYGKEIRQKRAGVAQVSSFVPDEPRTVLNVSDEERNPAVDAPSLASVNDLGKPQKHSSTGILAK